jgi:hypothetical protein
MRPSVTKVILALACCLALTSLRLQAGPEAIEVEKVELEKAQAGKVGVEKVDVEKVQVGKVDVEKAEDEDADVEKADDEKAEDVLSEHQSIDAFTSLEDGTPGPPGEVAPQVVGGWFTKSGEPDEYLLEFEFKWTPGGNPFLDNTELAVITPWELGANAVKGNGDIEFAWQQRWVKENGMVPTLATLAEIRTPTGLHSSGVDAVLTGVMAKEMGPGTVFLNVWGGSFNGNNIEEVRDFQWGFRAGYKWRVTEELAFLGGYAHETSEEEPDGDLNLLEFATQFGVGEHVTIGPGIVIGLDNDEETPDLGAGVLVEYAF